MTFFPLAAIVAAKLVIIAPDQAAIATDYPSMQRCHRAAEELKDQQKAALDKWFADTQVTVGSDFHWIDPANKWLGAIPAYPRPTIAQVYCVPG